MARHPHTGPGLRRPAWSAHDAGSLRQRPGQLQLRHHRRPRFREVRADERDGLVLPRHRRQGLDAGSGPLLREAVPQGAGHIHRVQARRGPLPQSLLHRPGHQRRHRHAGAGHLEDVLDAARPGGSPVQGHLGHGPEAVARVRPGPHDHRSARCLPHWLPGRAGGSQ